MQSLKREDLQGLPISPWVSIVLQTLVRESSAGPLLRVEGEKGVTELHVACLGDCEAPTHPPPTTNPTRFRANPRLHSPLLSSCSQDPPK